MSLPMERFSFYHRAVDSLGIVITVSREFFISQNTQAMSILRKDYLFFLAHVAATCLKGP